VHWREHLSFSPAQVADMEETLREAPAADDWRGALAQTIEQQRRKVGQRIAGQREKLRELESRIAQHLGEAADELHQKHETARESAARFQADEAAAKQRAADLNRREQELIKREQELGAHSAKAGGGIFPTGKGDAVSKQVLDDLAKKLAELDKRQAGLTEEEKKLTARQQELSLRQAELEQLQAGLSGQSAAHQARADELARNEVEIDKARQAYQAELQRHAQQQNEVRRLEGELKLKAQSLTDKERETLRQRRHVAQQLRSRKKELTAEIELNRSQAMATGAGAEHEVQLRLSELQGKYDRLREERDQREQQRDDAMHKLAEIRGQLDARQQDAKQREQLLEQAHKRVSDLEAERQRLQTDLQRHLEEAGRKAEAARLDMARRTTEAQTQAAEIARLAAELERVRRETQEQVERLRADQGKSHDEKIQSLHAQMDEVRKKVLAEQAAWDAQRKQLEAQLKTAEQKAASGGGKGSAEAVKELAKLRDENKQLETMLAATEARAKQGGASGGGGQEMEDLRRRFEMAVQDVRELKTKNAELSEQLSKARQGGGAAAAAGGGSDWESMKKRMMQQMEDDFDASDEQQKANKLTIEGAMKITDEVVAEKEKEILELRRALDSQAQSVGEVAVGAAAIAQVLDSDELVRQERDNLQKLQDGLREQLRKAEIDISLERAKLARERADLDEKLRTIEAERPAAGAPAAGADKGKKPAAGRKWLERLGLGEGKGQ
jgi:chromosome segregation ATPase